MEGMAQGSARVIRNMSVHFGFEGIGGGFWLELLLLKIRFRSDSGRLEGMMYSEGSLVSAGSAIAV